MIGTASSTQKRWVEWPLILLLVVLTQSLEISLFQKGPAFLGSVHIIPIVITYVALTRDWLKAVGIVTLFSVLGSATVAVPVGYFMGSQIWTALITKVLVSVMALEGRKVFSVLVMAAQLVAKMIILLLISSRGRTPEAFHFWIVGLSNAACMGLLAWFVYPFFLKWDIYFEHNEDDMPELNPRFN